MRILDKHITLSIVKIFISTVLVFSFLYILIEVTSTLDEIIDRKIPFDILLRYYITYLPIIFCSPTTSIACLISTLFTFSSLNNNNEIIAMRASGLNFWQITKPALFFALLISALIFLINEKYVPTATKASEEIRNNHMILAGDRIRKKNEKIKNLTFYGLKNRLYFIDSYDHNNEKLEGITIIEHDSEQNIRQKIVALEGLWTGIAWKFYKCQITTFDPDKINIPLRIKVYDEKLMDIKETPDDFLKQRIQVTSMNIKQLNAYINKFSSSGAKKALHSLRVDLHQKIAFPFGSFVIVITGLPFALLVRSRKKSTFAILGIAIIIGFLYFVANSVTLALGKGGLFPPIVAAWLAPILFTGIAIAVIEKNF